MTPTVSVIIPAYNAASYIGDTLSSVQKQSYTNWELWVIIDGATDHTEEVVLPFTQEDSRIHCMVKPNSGVSDTRNKGFEQSKGAYLAFLDADDIWLPHNLASKIQFFQSQPAVGLVHSDAEIINEMGIPQGEYKQGKEGNLLQELLLWEGTCIPAPSSILVKREVIEKVGGFDPDLSTAADQEFFFRVAHQYTIGRVPEVTWHYRVHQNNMHSNIALMEKDELLVYQKAKKNGLFSSHRFYKKCLSQMYLILAGSWWKEGNNKLRGIYFLSKSIWSYPPTIRKIILKFL